MSEDRLAALELALGAVREALSRHPVCGRYEPDDVISCGWKSAVADITATLSALVGAVTVSPQRRSVGMSAPIWEELGHDDRKGLAALFQDHCPLPNEGLSSRFYAALIAVANVGYQRARDHVACELGESWGESK